MILKGILHRLILGENLFLLLEHGGRKEACPGLLAKVFTLRLRLRLALKLRFYVKTFSCFCPKRGCFTVLGYAE